MATHTLTIHTQKVIGFKGLVCFFANEFELSSQLSWVYIIFSKWDANPKYVLPFLLLFIGFFGRSLTNRKIYADEIETNFDFQFSIDNVNVQ